jgi:hypothetical protein
MAKNGPDCRLELLLPPGLAEGPQAPPMPGPADPLFHTRHTRLRSDYMRCTYWPGVPPAVVDKRGSVSPRPPPHRPMRSGGGAGQRMWWSPCLAFVWGMGFPGAVTGGKGLGARKRGARPKPEYIMSAVCSSEALTLNSLAPPPLGSARWTWLGCREPVAAHHMSDERAPGARGVAAFAAQASAGAGRCLLVAGCWPTELQLLLRGPRLLHRRAAGAGASVGSWSCWELEVLGSWKRASG